MSEPPIGIEPITYALRVTWSPAVDALAALIARVIALMALAALGLSGDPFHDPFHASRPEVSSFCPWMALGHTSSQPGYMLAVLDHQAGAVAPIA
jgi:hypothetical protein